MSAFIAIDEGGRHTTMCECGGSKTKSAIACARCAYLDGERCFRSYVIAALRDLRRATIAELCVAVYGHHNQPRAVQMLHMLQRMARDGRVRRYYDEGAGIRRVCLMGKFFDEGAYVYVLTERGRA